MATASLSDDLDVLKLVDDEGVPRLCVPYIMALIEMTCKWQENMTNWDITELITYDEDDGTEASAFAPKTPAELINLLKATCDRTPAMRLAFILIFAQASWPLAFTAGAPTLSETVGLFDRAEQLGMFAVPKSGGWLDARGKWAGIPTYPAVVTFIAIHLERLLRASLALHGGTVSIHLAVLKAHTINGNLEEYRKHHLGPGSTPAPADPSFNSMAAVGRTLSKLARAKICELELKLDIAFFEQVNDGMAMIVASRLARSDPELMG